MKRQSSRRDTTHARIVETAAKAVRRAGYDGVGVADIMKQAGLTHGGFYAHFASRDALLVEAIEHAGQDSAERLAAGVAYRRARGASDFRALVEAYLSEAHLRTPEQGCPVAALVSDSPRQAAEVRAASTRRIDGLCAEIRQSLPHHAAPETAFVIASTLVGALQLARALGDNAQGKAVLKASRQALVAQYDS